MPLPLCEDPWELRARGGGPGVFLGSPVECNRNLVARTAAASAASLLSRPGLVNGQRPSLVVSSVERLDGLLGLGIFIHLHKAESARAAGFAICDDLGTGDLAMLLKQGEKIVGRGIPDQVAYIDILSHHNIPFRAVPRRHTRREKRDRSKPGPPSRQGLGRESHRRPPSGVVLLGIIEEEPRRGRSGKPRKGELEGLSIRGSTNLRWMDTSQLADKRKLYGGDVCESQEILVVQRSPFRLGREACWKAFEKATAESKG
jgi:hypothetical protein